LLYAVCAVAGVCAGAAGLALEPFLLRIRDSRNRSDEEDSPEPAGSSGPTQIERRLPAEQLVLPLLLGGVFALLASRYGWTGRREELILACLYAAILFLIAVIDFHTRLVLNVLSYPAAAIGLAGSALWAGIGFPSALLGAVSALALFFVIEIVGRGAMGRGDTKLAGVIGAMRGFPAVWQALVAGIVVGGIFAAGLLVTGRSRRSYFAYGPSLAIGAVISMLLTTK